jgi:hypothetical protein
VNTAGGPNRGRVDRARTWACHGSAAAALCLLIATYVGAYARGGLPKGHPWHGIALLCAAGWFLVQTRLGDGRRLTNIAAVVLPLAAATAAGFLFGLW